MNKSISFIYFRQEVLKNIDLEQIESIKENRAELINEVNTVIRNVINNNRTENYLSAPERQELCELVVDEITGYGPLRELMEDESISDILVNGPDRIFVERKGRLELSDKQFINNEQLTDIARRLVGKVGRRIDDAQPLVDARMPDGSRLNVVISPISIDGTSMSIRKFGKGNITLGELIKYGSMNEMMANFLVIASRCRVNIIVSGGTGSGKTTLLNAMSQYVDETERVLTLEDAAELRLQQAHVLRLETFEMLQAMNTGHDGSMSTLHANNPRDALARLESMVMMANSALPLVAIRRNISTAVNIIVQASRLPDGSRKVINISEVMGMEGENIILQDIFSYAANPERDNNGMITGTFTCNGLLQRSAVYRQALIHGYLDPLRQLFGNKVS